VLTAPQVRLALRKLTAASFPTLYILSYNEIAPDVEVSSVGNITLSDENQKVRSEEYVGSSTTGA
jgi:flagellar biosynthesis protein FlhA